MKNGWNRRSSAWLEIPPPLSLSASSAWPRGARATELSRETVAGLIDLLAERFPHAKRELPDVVDMGHRMVYAVLDQNLLFADGTPTGNELSDAKLTDELTCAVHAYLIARLAKN